MSEDRPTYETNSIDMFPVTGFTFRSVESRRLILMQLPFLAHSMQSDAEADPGRNYALTIPVAEDLRDALDRAIQTMKKSDTPESGDQTH